MRRQTKAGPILLAAFLASGAMCADVRAQAIPGEANHTASDSGGIKLFKADVTVRDGATLEVREEITVNNAARYYKYGFRRDLPINSTERWDPRYVGEYKRDNGVRVEIVDVSKDDGPVKWRQGTGYNYPQISIGERYVPLDSGEHRFVVHYIVNDVLSFGSSRAKRDTLYWNEIGNERDSPVAEALLTIHLPAGVPADTIETEARAAGRGVSSPRGPETTLERVDDPSGAIVYHSTNIAPRQSLSVAVTWPSGYVHKPRFEMLQRNRWLFAAPAALFLFYLIAWIRIGREPKPGPVVVAYEPPAGLSAAAMRYIAYGTTDGRAFAAVIAQLAIAGCLRVEPGSSAQNGKYKLSRLMSDRATEAALAPEEQRVLRLLFSDGPTIELSPSMEQQNAAKNSLYVAAIHDELGKKLTGKYLNRHIGIIALGVLATFAMALPLAFTAEGRDPGDAPFFTMWVLFCGLMIGMMVETSFVSAWRTGVRSGFRWVTLLPGLGAIGIFGTSIVYLLKQLAADASLAFALTIVAFLVLNLAWGPALKRKSALGRQVCDQIAGFRQFLQTVEQDRLNRLNPAQEILDDADRFLPYAIALEVKEAWGDHLAQTFAVAAVMVEG